MEDALALHLCMYICIHHLCVNGGRQDLESSRDHTGPWQPALVLEGKGPLGTASTGWHLPTCNILYLYGGAFQKYRPPPLSESLGIFIKTAELQST